MSSLSYGRGYVYYVRYHIVWCTKYRHKIILGEVEAKLKEILYIIAENNGFTIEVMETDLDHIHLLVNCSPQHHIPSIMKALKGASARSLFKEIPELKKKLWGGHLWNPSYFVATVSENTESQIKEYIEKQQVK